MNDTCCLKCWLFWNGWSHWKHLHCFPDICNVPFVTLMVCCKLGRRPSTTRGTSSFSCSLHNFTQSHHLMHRMKWVFPQLLLSGFELCHHGKGVSGSRILCEECCFEKLPGCWSLWHLEVPHFSAGPVLPGGNRSPGVNLCLPFVWFYCKHLVEPEGVLALSLLAGTLVEDYWQSVQCDFYGILASQGDSLDRWGIS